ncbi:MAG: hypothetical protein IPL69_10535 [Saprospiraceae bacterium]|nr:hypothetical protein [Candidatus Brachybacter algidus]
MLPRENAIPYAKVSGYCNVNETFHMTGFLTGRNGCGFSGESALSNAYLNSTDIGICTLTGLPLLITILLKQYRIKNVFGQQQLFASSKPFTGHTLTSNDQKSA